MRWRIAKEVQDGKGLYGKFFLRTDSGKIIFETGDLAKLL